MFPPGVGKTWEIAGIIMENWERGNKRTLWVTINSNLVTQGQAELQRVGFRGSMYACGIDFGYSERKKDGVLFCTYTNLKVDNKHMLNWLTYGQTQKFEGVVSLPTLTLHK